MYLCIESTLRNMATSKLKLLVVTSVLLLLYHTNPTQADGFSVVVEDVQAKTATVSWQTPPGNVTITVSLRSSSGPDNTTWKENEESRRVFTDLKEYTQYTVCVGGRDDESVLPEECATFNTSFTMRSVAAFGCSTFLLLSFCIVTVLDLVYGSVRPSEEKKKQDELLEEGAKTFKRKKGRKKRKKKESGGAGAQERVGTQERDSIVDQLLRDSGLDQMTSSAVRFEESPQRDSLHESVRDSIMTDEGSLTMAELASN